MDLETGFWQAYQRFLKTGLVTEAPNPKTTELSKLAKTDLPRAYQLLRELDLAAIDAVCAEKETLKQFQQIAQAVAKQGGRVILVGCGASGRIAAQVESWCHSAAVGLKVEAVLAGGDITLIDALESCEDNPEFARRQMALLDLQQSDWVIGLSAGGESPFILEALRFAKTKTTERPTLLCCNPAESLLERDDTHVAGDADMWVISLLVGPMALTGSTRMQATTAMTLFLILTLLPQSFDLLAWRKFYEKLDFSEFCGLIIWEVERFAAKQRVTYHVDSSMALPILADLTERAPTFNIARLYHESDHQNEAPVALILSDADDAKDAWQKLLQRDPKALEFADVPKTSMDYLLGFDLSEKGLDSEWKVSLKKAYPDYFDLQRRPGVSQIERDFLLRLILLNHSTLMMGRLGFYTGNLMTSVKPANFKLMDRTIRYVQFLAKQETGATPNYKAVAAKLFELMPGLQPGESIVFKLLQNL